MGMFNREVEPSRPRNIGTPGSLVVGMGINMCPSPKLVLESKPFWGNPNGDNTAEHWHWKYLLINEVGKPTWTLAKYWKVFSAS